MKKGKGNGKGHFYWRKKIQNEKRNPNSKIKGRIRSKGEAKTKSRFSPPLKGRGWTNKIKAERGVVAKTKIKKAPLLKKQVSLIKPNNSFKAKQAPVVKSLASRKVALIKNKITPSKLISQPITTKREVNLLKKRQAVVVKAPKSNEGVQNKIAGIVKLKSASLKNKPANPSVKAGKVPSKGAMLLKKSANKIANQPRNVKRVKQPVIRKGR